MMATRLPTVDSSQITTNSCSGTLVESDKVRASRERKRLPKWFKTSLPIGKSQSVYNSTMASVKDNDLNTVCVEARCPNIHDCWGRGTATFMIAEMFVQGAVDSVLSILRKPSSLNPDEPEDLATAIESMGINHAVITVVNRDDLSDGGQVTTESV